MCVCVCVCVCVLKVLLKMFFDKNCYRPEVHLEWSMYITCTWDHNKNVQNTTNNHDSISNSKTQMEIQWRIQNFPEEGTPTPKVGLPTYYLVKISRKLHENERIRTQKRAHVPAPPPLDVPMKLNVFEAEITGCCGHTGTEI